MYEPIRDVDPRWRAIHRWIWLAMPDDAAQEVRLTYIEYPHLTDAARAALISQRLRQLAHDCWRRDISRRPPCAVRPSKLKRATGYRCDTERKRVVRLALEQADRQRIAALGGRTRWTADEISSARS